MKRYKHLIIMLLIVGMTFQIYATGNMKYGLEANKMSENVLIGLPKPTVNITNVEEQWGLAYVGIDFGVFVEEQVSENDLRDDDSDGIIFAVKKDKVKRFITRSTSISIDLGEPKEYQKGVIHKMAYRVLFTPLGTEDNVNDNIIIANEDNEKEGWILIPGSEFMLSYFAPLDLLENPIVKHTDTWEENRIAYNLSKEGSAKAGEEPINREYTTFWAGEKFLLEIKLTEEVEELHVGIFETTGAGVNAEYSVVLDAKNINLSKSAEDENVVYCGEIWERDMITRWWNEYEKQIIFRVDAVVSGVALETLNYPIYINNKEEYFRLKKIIK